MPRFYFDMVDDGVTTHDDDRDADAEPQISTTGGDCATLNTHRAGLPKGKLIEIWFQDEARIGQKNGLVRQWARRGSRPRQPAIQRYESAYLFGAICPARGTGAALAVSTPTARRWNSTSSRSRAVLAAAPTPCSSSN